jgi:hypothetical protein
LLQSSGAFLRRLRLTTCLLNDLVVLGPCLGVELLGLHARDTHEVLSLAAGSSSEPVGFALGLTQHAQRIAFCTFGYAASLGLGLLEEVLGRGPSIGSHVFGIGPARPPFLFDLGHRFSPPAGRIRRGAFPHALGCYPRRLEHIANLMTEGGKFGAEISFGEFAEASGESVPLRDQTLELAGNRR